MTDDDKALVNEARLDAKSFRENTIYTMDGVPARLIANANRLDQYADRLEALSAENERLREALTQIARLRTDLSGDFSLGSKQSDIARAALGETK